MVKSITTTSTVQDGNDPTEPEPAARLHARVNPPQHDDGFTLHTRTALLTHNDCLTRPDYDRRRSQSDGSYDRRCHRGSDPRATWHASRPTGTAHGRKVVAICCRPRSGRSSNNNNNSFLEPSCLLSETSHRLNHNDSIAFTLLPAEDSGDLGCRGLRSAALRLDVIPWGPASRYSAAWRRRPSAVGYACLPALSPNAE